MNRWLATTALVRAVSGTVGGIAFALLLGEPVLLLLVTPLAVFAALATRGHPTTVPQAATRLDTTRLREGEATTWRLGLRGADDAEHLTRVLPRTRHVVLDPGPVVGGVLDATDDVADVAVGASRWGIHELGHQQVSAHSAWAGYRWGPVEQPGARLTALPTPAPFDATAELPQPDGLVGAHRSSRNGDGTEFSGIRPFVPGDRLRRIDWRVSLRTGDLHVVTTRAEQDAGVLLVVDALADHGRSRGVHGEPSSLDVTVRAALALAEHHLRNGDRVGLRILGAAGGTVGYRSGTSQVHRIQTLLARVRPGVPHDLERRLRFPCPPGTVVLVLSPMLHDIALRTTGTLASRGLPVTLIDTLPATVGADDTSVVRGLAWRMRLLERESLLERVAHTGCPVIAWRGPGTIDDVMRQLNRRASLPRAGAR